MKRLPEEVELRKVLNHLPVSKLRGGGVRGYYSGRITALIRAVRADEREECAKVADLYWYEAKVGMDKSGEYPVNPISCAAAIRRREGER